MESLWSSPLLLVFILGWRFLSETKGSPSTVTWNTRSITLVSDGTMVQIIVKGLQSKYYWGWCRNASRMMMLASSPKNCHVSYPEPPDQSINRTAVKER
uniref:Secreted protein n=1 Tax=Knipowitschia caucasica TaxID=637954 RepID=A0AAV2KM15_KNICA